MNGRLNFRDRLFIRLDKRGIAIADSAMWRKQIPRGQGHWKDITDSVLGCCSTAMPTQSSFLVFQGTSLNSSSELTSVSYPGYSWEGSVKNGDMLVVPIPYDMSETITLSVTVLSAAMSIAVSTAQGDGTITVDDSVISTDTDPQTVILTITSDPGSQYLVVLTDD